MSATCKVTVSKIPQSWSCVSLSLSYLVVVRHGVSIGVKKKSDSSWVDEEGELPGKEEKHERVKNSNVPACLCSCLLPALPRRRVAWALEA